MYQLMSDYDNDDYDRLSFRSVSSPVWGCGCTEGLGRGCAKPQIVCTHKGGSFDYCEECCYSVTNEMVNRVGLAMTNEIYSYLDDRACGVYDKLSVNIIDRSLLELSMCVSECYEYPENYDVIIYRVSRHKLYATVSTNVNRARPYAMADLLGFKVGKVIKAVYYDTYWEAKNDGVDDINSCIRAVNLRNSWYWRVPEVIYSVRDKVEFIKDQRVASTTVINSKYFIIALKAYLFDLIAKGLIVEASVADRQIEVVGDISSVFVSIFKYIYTFLYVLGRCAANSVYEIVNWEYYKYLEFFMILNVIIYLWMIVTREKKMALEEGGNKSYGKTRFISKTMTSSGTTYKFVYDGKLIEVPEADDEEFIRIEEMALPGSELYPSSNRQVGAIMVSVNNSDLKVIGCFWRMDDYLITAAHVANAISSGVAEVYLARHTEKKNVRRLDLRGVIGISRDDFKLENNAFPYECYDVFAVKLKKGVWSKIGLTAVSTKINSSYGLMISATGFVDDLLMASAGKTLSDSGPIELYHTASTNKGFSGSPLFCGNSVVGMHVAAENGKNVAVRIELIKYALREEESNSTEGEDYYRDYKLDGGSWQMEHLDEMDVLYNKQGRVRYGDFGDEYLDYDEQPSTKYKKRLKSYNYRDNENADPRNLDSRPGTPPVSNKTGSCDAPAARLKKGKKKHGSVPYKLITTEKPVHCNSTPKEEPEATNYLDEREEELKKLGYDPSKYLWPEINEVTEERSLLHHLKLFDQRVKKIQKAPSVKELERVANIAVQMMASNRYEAPKDYKKADNLKRIINSSLIKADRSPGHPYQASGLMTNGLALRHYGVDNFVEIVQNEWNEEFQLKCFLKGEPHKKAKIDKGMIRIITGMPLHKTVKDQALFENFRRAMVEEWEKSPVKYCFSPLVPGHIKHLANTFKGRKVADTDKTNWDFYCFDWVYEMASRVIKGLAYKPLGMTDEEYQEYLNDVDQSIKEKYIDSKYRCTNGKVFSSAHNGIMKSGSLLTIDINSISQLCLDIIIKMRMGWSDDQIMADPIVVGGDDVIQSFPDDMDYEGYIREAKILGFELPAFKINDSFDGVEFFSNHFYKENGIWKFRPERFTKHVQNLRKVKIDDLASALNSAMLNHAWDDEKYEFFSTMFLEMKKKYPNAFPIHLLVNKDVLRYRLLGCELDE